MTSESDNNLVAAGAIFAVLSASRFPSLTTTEVVVNAEGNATNQIEITLSFMESPYRVTVERVVS
jgi:hypothetical protein